MSAFKLHNLSTLTNVAKGSRATLTLPLGVSYDMVQLQISGVTKAQIKDIECRINGKPFQYFVDAERVDDINDYYKRGTDANFVDLWFMRPEMETTELAMMTSIGTADISTFDIAFTVDAAAANPVITAHAIKSPLMPLGLITKIRDFPVSSSSSGLKELDNIPKEGRIAAIHSFKADISKLEVKVDNNPIQEYSKVMTANVQSKFERTPNAAKHTTADFILRGTPLGGLPMRYPATHPLMPNQKLNDFRIINTLDTSGAFDVVVEYLTSFAGI